LTAILAGVPDTSLRASQRPAKEQDYMLVTHQRFPTTAIAIYSAKLGKELESWYTIEHGNH
jgi:hypothetical protein